MCLCFKLNPKWYFLCVHSWNFLVEINRNVRTPHIHVHSIHTHDYSLLILVTSIFVQYLHYILTLISFFCLEQKKWLTTIRSAKEQTYKFQKQLFIQRITKKHYTVDSMGWYCCCRPIPICRTLPTISLLQWMLFTLLSSFFLLVYIPLYREIICLLNVMLFSLFLTNRKS